MNRTMRTLLRHSLAFSMIAALAACGGSDEDEDPVPTGAALSSIQFVDNDSYYPMDKLAANGTVLTEGAANYGTVNSKRRRGDRSMSVWGIDTSATSPAGSAIEYSMRIDSIVADSAALSSMQANLRIDPATGLIYQQCSGFPNCYDNTSGRRQEFKITAIARVSGSARTLERAFTLSVIAN